MHEILTLQFGQYANFVGTHFWNLQESYFTYDPAVEPVLNHDILFRAGQGTNGIETYSPRLLLFDLKGGFGSVKKINKLYESYNIENENGMENENDGSRLIEKHISEPYPQNEYIQSLDDENHEEVPINPSTVQLWSDFNRMYYHPKSLVQIDSYMYENESMPFDSYVIGREASEELEREKDVFDENFRFFVEECDNIQGFNFLTHMSDGYSGVVSAFIERARDEYPKTPMLVHGLEVEDNANTERRQRIKLLNEMMFISKLTSLSAIVVPIRKIKHKPKLKGKNWMKYIKMEDRKFDTSGLIAAHIEAMMLPHQQKKDNVLLQDRINWINWRGNTPIAHLVGSIPIPKSSIEGQEILHDFSSELEVTEEILSQSSVARGHMNVKDDMIDELLGKVDGPFHYKFISKLSFSQEKAYPNIFPNLPFDEITSLTTYRITSKTHKWLKDDYLNNFLFKGSYGNVVPHDLQDGRYAITKEIFSETFEDLWTLVEAYDFMDVHSDEMSHIGTDED